MSLFVMFYIALLAGLSLFGLHRYWLVWGSGRTASAHAGAGDGAGAGAGAEAGEGNDPDNPGTVLIQIPIYNEDSQHVCRLMDSAVALDWPSEQLEIQVLDDSDDGSEEIVFAHVEQLRAAGARIEQVRRPDRAGYKAGALKHGMARSSASMIAIFDADFVIPTDFLSRTVPLFRQQNIGMVQARWGFTNEHHSLLTRIQAVMLDGHFHIEHRARAAAGRFFNFNGTAGIWRRRAIDDAGGWRADTITEDLDLSLRAWLAGWRFRYLDDLVAPSELPQTMEAYKLQQNRWVSGSAQTAARYGLTILRSGLDWPTKLDTLFYLTANIAYPLLLALALCLPPALLLRLGESGSVLLWSDVPFFCLATLSVLVYGSRVRGRRRFWPYFLVRLPALMALGLGMTPHNTRAILKGLLGRARVFERTPKGSGRALRRRRRRDPLWSVESFMALYVLGCFGAAAAAGSLGGLPFMGLFACGYLYVLLPAHFPVPPEDGETL